MIVLATQWMHSANHQPEALEVLARMVLPSKKIAVPAEFMAITGMTWSDLDVEVFSLLNIDQEIVGLNKPIFVNISPETLEDPATFALCADLLSDLVARKRARVVVEVPCKSPLQGDRLAHVLGVLHAGDIAVAIDDYGVEHSTRERLDSQHWDYCKVNLSTLKFTPDLEWLLRLDRTCAERGTKIVFERLERIQDIDVLKAFPGAWIQGYAMSRPEFLGGVDAAIRRSDTRIKDFGFLPMAI